MLARMDHKIDDKVSEMEVIGCQFLDDIVAQAEKQRVLAMAQEFWSIIRIKESSILKNPGPNGLSLGIQIVDFLTHT